MGVIITESEEYNKKLLLFEKQKHMLDVFLEHNAITKEQYDKSVNGMREKMNIK